MNRQFHLLPLLILTIVAVPFLLSSKTQAQLQPHSSHHGVSDEAGVVQDPEGTPADGSWEGSAQGIAYSEFNHRFVGLFVLLFGFAELIQAMQSSSPIWTRLVLPAALGVVGIFLLVWSDHEAWPIGSLGFVQTFFGEDREIVQHKLYGILAAAAASSETLRRIGWARHPAWAVPLIVLGIGGGLLLFAHSHGAHPSHEKIESHHALMGVLGVGAGVSRALATWMACSSNRSARAWEFVWAGLILLMGVQLLIYFE
jgi:putative copper resistance protein D